MAMSDARRPRFGKVQTELGELVPDRNWQRVEVETLINYVSTVAPLACQKVTRRAS